MLRVRLVWALTLRRGLQGRLCDDTITIVIDADLKVLQTAEIRIEGK